MAIQDYKLCPVPFFFFVYYAYRLSNGLLGAGRYWNVLIEFAVVIVKPFCYCFFAVQKWLFWLLSCCTFSSLVLDRGDLFYQLWLCDFLIFTGGRQVKFQGCLL